MDAHQVINMLLFEQTFMSDVKWNKCDGNSRMEHNMCGMWVHKNIKLCQRTHVPRFLNRATHNDQFFDGCCEPRLLANCHCNIGERRDGKDADLVGFSQHALD